MKSRVLTVALLLLLLSLASPAIGQPLQQIGDHAVYLPLIMNNYHSDLINGDFESGPGVGWYEFSEQSKPIIMDYTKTRVHNGLFAAKLGSEYGETAYISQPVVVSAEKPYLIYWHDMDSTDPECNPDLATEHVWVKVNSDIVYYRVLCQGNATNGWQKISIDLSDPKYIGHQVTIKFEILTFLNPDSGWYLDDISFSAAP